MTELTVTIKGETENGDMSSYKQKFLLYDNFQFAQDDKIVQDCIKQALANARIKPDTIKVSARMEVS